MKLGVGLRAIIRDTTSERHLPLPGGPDEGTLQLKTEIERLEEEGENAVLGIRGELDVAKEANRSLVNEIESLRKTVFEEMPNEDEVELVVKTLRERAEKFERGENLLDAFNIYRRILRLSPSDLKALYCLATIYYSAGIVGRAINCLEAILEWDSTQDNVRDPFFTTKTVGVETGLELYICYEIIKQHDGEISIQSEKGEGTAFIIKLPVHGISATPNGKSG